MYWILALLLLVYIPFSSWADLELTRQFYHNGFVSNRWTDAIYVWGLAPADITAFAAASVFLASYIKERFRPYRADALILVLTLAIGSGLIVHAGFKEHWGRPRPKQVVEFGGDLQFRPFYSPNFDSPVPAKSFTCGHCTMGFYFFAFIWIGKNRKKPWITAMGWLLGVGLGGILSVVRIMQGGHWLSDVLASLLIMVVSAFVISKVVYRMEGSCEGIDA